MAAHNTHPTERSTVYVVRPGRTITLDDGVTLGPGTEVCGDEVPDASDDDMYVRAVVPGSPTQAQIGSLNLAVPSLAAGPMLTASRTTGVAPLMVTFDVIGSGTGVVQASSPAGWAGRLDWASVDYWWDFDDDNSETWAFSDRDKNKANGYVATHVFETDGTYDVTLHATDAAGNGYDYVQTITVTDPEDVYAGATYYVKPPGAGGSDAADGLSELNAWATADWALRNASNPDRWLGSDGPRRILFARGGTYTLPGEVHPSAQLTGPFHLGAFGSGAKPVVTCTTNGIGLGWSGSQTVATNDVRIVDVDFTGLDWTGSDVHAFAAGRNCLVLRSTMQHFANVVNTIQGAHAAQFDDNAFVECNIFDGNHYGVFYGVQDTADPGVHISFLGCDFTCTDTAPYGFEILNRIYCHRSVLSHNRFRDARSSSLRVIGSRSPHLTEFVMVSHNLFETKNTWPVEIGPESDQAAAGSGELMQLLENVIFEGNHVKSMNGALQYGVLAWRHYITVRNNIFDMTGAGSRPIVVGARNNSGPPPTRCRVVNNTAYCGDGGSLILVSGGPNGGFNVTMPAGEPLIVFNNIVCAAGGMSLGAGTINAQANLLVLPNLVAFVDAANDDFRLQQTSPAVNGCVLAPARKDLADVERPIVTVNRDRGAHEFVV